MGSSASSGTMGSQRGTKRDRDGESARSSKEVKQANHIANRPPRVGGGVHGSCVSDEKAV